MDIPIAIRQAKAAVVKNDIPTAQKILKDILKEEPNSKEAWLILARVVDNNKYARECLERVLFLEPGNEEALKHLEELNDPLSDLYDFTEEEKVQEDDFTLELPNAYARSGEGLTESKRSKEPTKPEDDEIYKPDRLKTKPRKKVKKTKQNSNRALEIFLIVIMLVMIGAIVVILISQFTEWLPF
jgi:hypothetical protein